MLVETRRDAATGHLIGLTANYQRVLVEGSDRHMNTIVPTLIESVHPNGNLWGRIV